MPHAVSAARNAGLRDLRSATAITLAAAATFALVYAGSLPVADRASAASLATFAAALTIRTGRRDVRLAIRTPFVREAAIWIAVALAANLVGLVVRASYAAGAVVYAALMYLAIYARQFGGRAREAGSLLALPLVAILVVPVPHVAAVRPLVRLALVLAASVVALVALRCAEATVDRDDSERATPSPPARVANLPTGIVTLSTTSRTALQNALALLLAFAIGHVFFGTHAAWVVVTAFVVGAGGRGRTDVLHKSASRLAGALAGSFAATLVERLTPAGPAVAACAFGAIFAGLALRRRSYAYWAAAMTVVLGLLSGGTFGPRDQAVRLLAIVAGAACGVATAWFVFPVTTERVVLGRLALALRALDAAARAQGDERREAFAAFDAAVDRLNELGAATRFHRRLTRGDRDDHPAVWIAALERIRERAADGRGRVFAADVGAARRALGRRSGRRAALARTSSSDAGLAAALERIASRAVGESPAAGAPRPGER